MRIGLGYDIHRLVAGRRLVIGCVQVPHDTGEDGYSDGDVLTHALIDALLGAAGAGDIGCLFPPGEPEWKDAPGERLLAVTSETVRKRGWRCAQIDTVVILERPRLRPFIDDIRRSIARILEMDENCISIKAKTKEGCGEVGAGKAVESYAVVLLEPA